MGGVRKSPDRPSRAAFVSLAVRGLDMDASVDGERDGRHTEATGARLPLTDYSEHAASTGDAAAFGRTVTASMGTPAMTESTAVGDAPLIGDSGDGEVMRNCRAGCRQAKT